MDWWMVLKAFLVGGAFCVVGQVLVDLTKLTPARILVCYVVAGVALTGLGVYDPLVQFAGAGATVPLTGFGYAENGGATAEQVMKAVGGGFMFNNVRAFFSKTSYEASSFEIQSNLFRMATASKDKS